MNPSLRLTIITLLLAVSYLSAATRYVWQERGSLTPSAGRSEEAAVG
jgi:hypothetical protein